MKLTHRCLEVRTGGAAPDFPLAFFSFLLYIVLMLFIHPASIAASKPVTPNASAFSAISLSSFCMFRCLCCTG